MALSLKLVRVVLVIHSNINAIAMVFHAEAKTV
jgi:hypothetical protein